MAFCVLLETLTVILLLSTGTIRERSVGIVTRLRDEQKKEIWSQFRKVKYFALLDASIVALWPIQVPVHRVTGVNFPEVRRACG